MRVESETRRPGGGGAAIPGGSTGVRPPWRRKPYGWVSGWDAHAACSVADEGVVVLVLLVCL